jgi:hypothetical protein
MTPLTKTTGVKLIDESRYLEPFRMLFCSVIVNRD